MKQQINLYQAEFQQPDIALSADHIFMGAGALLAMIVLCSGGLAVSNAMTGRQLAAVKAEVESLKRDNEQMTGRVQNRSVDQALVARATEASRQLQGRQDVLRLVESTEQRRDTVNFSELLAGLARQHVDGMWLSRIEISSNGRDMLLEGSTLDAGQVPRFVGNLGREPVYAGREFRKVMIRRNETNDALLDFVLTSGDPESESLLAFKKEGSR